MRLHQLEVTAFGPFGGTVRVDFDTLGADGLFLLHGQTGAGKTTVLDAVAFALYGRVPGTRHEGRRLLSDHAAPGTPPKVVLEVTVDGRRMRITRSPEYQRAKLRGSGTTKENARATLEWLDGRGENLTRADEIGATVSGLLGMSADQFFQVVLLPQGDFARFLRADSDDRGVLLERLFDTGRFADVEAWFAQHRRDSENRVSGVRSEVERLAAQVCAAAGIEAGADGDPIAWAQRLARDARDADEAAESVLTAARARAQHTDAELRRAREVQQLRERAAVARSRLDVLAAGEPGRAELVVEHDRAVRAVPVAVARDLATRAAETAERERVRVHEDARAVAAQPEGRALLERVGWPAGPDDTDVLAAAVQSWRDEVVRLSGLIDRVGRRRDLQAEVDAARARRDALSGDLRLIAMRRVALPDELAGAEATLTRVRAVAATLPAVTDQRSAIQERLSAAMELVDARAALEESAERHRGARDAHLDARDTLAAVRERRIAGMAAELATGLSEGAPCAVCGSDRHPAPARPVTGAITRADEDAAQATEQCRAGEVESARGVLVDHERRVAELTGRTAGAGRDALLAALADVDTVLAGVEAACVEEKACTATVSALRAEGDELARRAEALSADLATLDQQITDISDRLADVDRAVADAAGDEADLRSRHDRLEALATATTRLRDRRVVATAAVVAADAATTELDRAARGAGFPDPDAARHAARSGTRIEQIAAVLAEARDERVRAEAVLTDTQVREALAAGPVDVAAAEAAHLEAVSARDEAIRAATAAAEGAAKVQRYATALAAKVGALGPVLARHEELAALADVVAGRGQNGRRMSLRSYVLAARLEDVALSASARLRRMSSGRYEFVHEDGAGPRGKRGGLGLDIRDDYTGVVRSAKTLSGGESFLASLALALGLADVVAAESGARVLDTMFIDEGFGTLDAETLESVMEVLDDLRAGGRVVGIVSHVDDMRQRIPSRLHVLRGRTGSTLSVVAG